ncbi:hypothetical protein HDU76_008846, partial [Blyttiomyces sp. JEL0837]
MAAMKPLIKPTSTSNDVNQHQGHDRNLWNRIPFEIKINILSHSDPLTKHLNNPTTNMTPSQARSIWLEAFRQDWAGDLALLPKYGFPSIYNGLAEVRSRSMYDQLCQLRPDLCHPTAIHLQVYLTDNTRYGWFETVHCKSLSYLADAVVAVEEQFGDEVEGGGDILVTPEYVIDPFKYEFAMCKRMESHLIQVAMRHCWMDLLDVWIIKNPVKVAIMAICCDHLELLKVLVEDRKLVTLKEFVSSETTAGPYTIAAQNGNLDMIKFLLRKGCPPKNVKSALVHAIRSGHLEMVQFIYDHYKEFNPVSSFQAYFGRRDMYSSSSFCVGTKNMELWRWFCQLGVEKYYRQPTLIYPVVTNDQDAQTVVKILGEGKVDWYILKACAYQGNISAFSILWSQRHLRPQDSELAKLDTIPAMVKLLETCCEFDHHYYPSTPEAIRLVHQYGSPNCSITDSTLNVDFVQKLIENCTCNNSEWSKHVIDLAAEYGWFDLVVYLHHVRPAIEFTKRAMDLAAGTGHLNIVRFLHENRREGCTTDAMDKAASKGFLDIVKFLHENRQEGCTTAAMDQATRKGFLNVVRYLFLNRKEGCSPGALGE